MALGGKVDDPIDPVLLHYPEDEVVVSDVALNEVVIGVRLYRSKVLQIAGIGERIKVVEMALRIALHHAAKQRTADEARPAGDEDMSIRGIHDSSSNREIKY